MRRGGLTAAIICTMGLAAVHSCPPWQNEPSGPPKPQRRAVAGSAPPSLPGLAGECLGLGLQALEASGVSCCKQDTEARGLLPRRLPLLSPEPL